MGHPAFIETHHRPWPLPTKPWIMKQQWKDLLFLHWEIPVEEVQPYLPPSLQPDLYQGKAFIGLVPFFMSGLTGRFCPTVKCLSDFAEFNVRTYVTHNGKPGVYFLSLDVCNKIAVWIANKIFHLPYRQASLTYQRQEHEILYGARFSQSEEFKITYSKKKSPLTLENQSFLCWATSRYCLYTTHQKSGRLMRGEIHHPSWSLYDAEYEIHINSMLERFSLGALQPVAYSPHIDVVVYPLEYVT